MVWFGWVWFGLVYTLFRAHVRLTILPAWELFSGVGSLVVRTHFPFKTLPKCGLA